MAYDAARNAVVLFGGQDAVTSNYRSDTWELTGSTWTSAAIRARGIPARTLITMAYDSRSKRVVVFGGTDSGFSDMGSERHRLVGPLPRNHDASGPLGAWHGLRRRAPAGRHVRQRRDRKDLDVPQPRGHLHDRRRLRHEHLRGRSVLHHDLHLRVPARPWRRHHGVRTTRTNATDPDTCTGTSSCDGSGACKKAQGQLCSANSECEQYATRGRDEKQ